MAKLIPGISLDDFSYMEECYGRNIHKEIKDHPYEFVLRVQEGIRQVYLNTLFQNLSTGCNGVKNPNFNQYVFDEVHGLGLRREKDKPEDARYLIWCNEGRDKMKKEVLELIIRHAIWLRQLELEGSLDEKNPYHSFRCDLQSWLEHQNQ